MDQVIASQIRHAFSLHSLDTHTCLYSNALTQQPCTVTLPESALRRAGMILEHLAASSPAIAEDAVRLTYGFSLVETFRRLAISVLCPDHGNAPIIANLIHCWLTIAVENSHLFALMPMVRRSLPHLQRCLPQYIEKARYRNPLRNFAQNVLLRRHTPTVRQTVLEALDGMLIVYFEDFMRNSTEGADSRLALRQLGYDSGLLGISESTVGAQSQSADPTTDQPTQSQRSVSPLPQAQDNAPPPVPERSPLRTTETNPPSFNSFTLTYDSSPTMSDASTVIGHDTASSPGAQIREDAGTTEDAEDAEDEDCVICTHPLHAETTSGCRTCRKYLHTNCLSPWAQQAWNRSQQHFTCPLCRSPWRYHRSIERVTESQDNVVFTIDTVDIPSEMFEPSPVESGYGG